MKTTVRDGEEGRREMFVEVGWDAVRADYKEILYEYSQTPIAGFRSGKAPIRIVESRRQRQILGEVATRCAQRLVRQALELEGLKTTGPVALMDMELTKEGPFSFKAEFTVVPEFDLPAYKAYRCTGQDREQKRNRLCRWLLDNTEIEVTDELVEKEVASETTS